jgi:hypothetical protein
LEKLKERRSQMIVGGHTHRAIERHCKALLELVLKMKAAQRATTGN